GLLRRLPAREGARPHRLLRPERVRAAQADVQGHAREGPDRPGDVPRRARVPPRRAHLWRRPGRAAGDPRQDRAQPVRGLAPAHHHPPRPRPRADPRRRRHDAPRPRPALRRRRRPPRQPRRQPRPDFQGDLPMRATTTTLLKHEWLRTRGPLATLFGLIALVGVLGSLLGASGWPLSSALGLAAGMLAAVVAVPAVQLALAADYWRSGYGRTGYFTHSIPVRGARIFRAKLAWTMLASLAAIVL